MSAVESSVQPSVPPSAVLLDLDGVVWLAHEAIPGSPEAIADLRAAGIRVVFVTNNSSRLVADQEASLAAIGIPAVGDVVTSAQAAARLVVPGERVLVCAAEGVVEALEGRGAVPVDARAVDEGAVVDAVVVGFHRNFDYEGLRRAATAVRTGARLVATNDDPVYPTPGGPIPGGGSILAAVRTAAGVEPTIAGKPHEPMADLVRSVIGADAVQHAVMIGDRPDTDGLFARRLGCRFGLVWSGVTAPDDDLVVTPDLTGADLRSLVVDLLAAARASGRP